MLEHNVTILGFYWNGPSQRDVLLLGAQQTLWTPLYSRDVVLKVEV